MVRLERSPILLNMLCHLLDSVAALKKMNYSNAHISFIYYPIFKCVNCQQKSISIGLQI